MGTELLLGEIVDTNAVYIATEFKKYGVSVHHRQTVDDHLGRIVAAIECALGRSDLVVLGGGLGPTEDDLTREAVAQVLGETPTVDPVLLHHIQHMYASRGRSMPQSNLKQAWMIPSARSLSNPVGSAPGWLVHTVHQGQPKQIVALPGPPHEMVRMWREEVLPRLQLPQVTYHHITLHTSGIGESNIADLLASDGELKQAFHQDANPIIATYARKTGVDLRVSARAQTLEEAKGHVSLLSEKIYSLIGTYIFGQDEETLPEAINRLLLERNETVALSEQSSVGWVACGLMEIQFSTFAGATVFSSSEGLEAPERRVVTLARQACEQLGSTWGLSSVSLKGKEEGYVVHIAVVGPGHEKTYVVDWVGEREQVQQRSSNAAFMGLFWALRGHA